MHLDGDTGNGAAGRRACPRGGLLREERTGRGGDDGGGGAASRGIRYVLGWTDRSVGGWMG